MAKQTKKTGAGASTMAGETERVAETVAPVASWRARRGAVDLACLRIIAVPRADVVANNYNPNSVAPDKLELLAESIAANGFCFPIVVIRDEERGVYVIVDGFHRWTMCGPEWLDIDPVPVVVLHHGMTERLAATWQFNKARGSHSVDLDAELIRALIEQGLSDDEVGSRLGVDLDTVHRYKQVTGIAALFARSPYSAAWAMVDDASDAAELTPSAP
jgi:ParB-like chromosome segregation protein Spo0J